MEDEEHMKASKANQTPRGLVRAAAGLAALSIAVTAPAVEALYSFQCLYSFQLGPRNPQAGLVLSPDGNLYGTTYGGGSGGYGTLFRLTPNGRVTTLLSFGYTNGANPEATLALDPGRLTISNLLLYGTTYQGGPNDLGTVFGITTNGVLSTLVNFDGTNGAYPTGGLVSDTNGNVYGTAYGGGASYQGYAKTPGYGTVFQLTPAGGLAWVSFQNTNGSGPQGPLTLGADGNLYGTTANGGTSNEGTVFKVTFKNGVGEWTNLLSFTFANGANPCGGLVQGKDLSFYGTTANGGSSSNGTVFKVTADGSLTTLFSFNGLNGSNPQAGLVLGNDGEFYGTTYGGGAYASGTLFEITTQGALATIVSFDYVNGAGPQAALTKDSLGNLYGTTAYGGLSGNGTAFKLTPAGEFSSLVSLAPGAAAPAAGLLAAADGGFYGTTTYGGSNSPTLFRITPAGTLTLLIPFNGVNTAGPSSPLIQVTNITSYATNWTTTTNWTTITGNITNSYSATSTTSSTITAITTNFYGTTYAGGTSSNGTVFRMTPPGPVTNLVSFGVTNGAHPQGALLQASDGNLYGTTSQGGPTDTGSVFKLALTPTVSLTTLASFIYVDSSDGAFPQGALIQGGDGNLYGTTAEGGAANCGTVFMVTTTNPANPMLITLASFDGTNGCNPQGGLLQASNGAFYGVTSSGGAYGCGAVFEMTTNLVPATLASFSDAAGYGPQGPLLQGTDGNFYGTTYSGGPGGYGTLFRITPGGVLTTEATFDGISGAYPNGGLALGSDGNLYGTTAQGGTEGGGTVFRLCPVTFSTVENQISISWSTNAYGLTLQCATSLNGPVTWRSSTNSPVLLGPQWTLTRQMPLSGTVFYRLNTTN